MSALPFAKGHGLGNDYIVLDAAALPWPLTPPRVRRICDRHRGIGSDGILLGHLDERPFRLEIFNPDGTGAEKSGNGLRIFGAFLHRRGLVATGDAFAVRLPRDSVSMTVEAAPPTGILDIIVDMGPADFRGQAAGFNPVPGEALRTPLELPDGEVLEVNPVSLANPHCVVFIDAFDRADFLRRGPQLASHAAFPAGTNVQLARVLGPDRLQAWIWERGAGETQASGSSACAVASVARRLGLVSGENFTVEMEGGSVRVRVGEDWQVRLRGEVEMVMEGALTEALTALIGAL